jgi:hypothetical protein
MSSITSTTPPQVTPSISTGIMGGVPAISAEEQAYLDALNPDKQTKVDEDAIRRSQTDAFQAEIDALNAIYAEQKRQATIAGMGRLGSEGAIQARRGLLGSSFGTAQTAGVTSQNTAEQKAIDAEQAAKIAVVMGNMRKATADEIAAKRKAVTEGSEATIKYLKEKGDRTKQRTSDIVKSLIAGDVEPTEDDINTMAKELGVAPEILKTQYITAQKEQKAKEVKAEQEAKKVQSELDTELSTRLKNKADLTKPFSSGGYNYQYDPQTGNYTKTESRSVSGEKNQTVTEIESQAKADLYQTIAENPGLTIKELVPKFPELKIEDIQQILDTLE